MLNAIKESQKKGGLLAIGLALVTAGYGFFQMKQQWLGIASIAVGIAVCFASQLLHIESEEIKGVEKEVDALKEEVVELKGGEK